MFLSDVSLIVTAGHRPGYLKECLNGILEYLPEATTIVVTDDSRDSSWFNLPPKTIWKMVPHDTFLTRKRNVAVQLVDTEYTVLLADDFVIDEDTRYTIFRMQDILETYSQLDVIGGNFKNRPYEGHLKVVEGQYIQEIALDTKAEPIEVDIWQVDLTANFFMARTTALQEVPWDESIGPIGGEHADWFLDMKAAGKVVGWAPGININEQEKDALKEADYYGTMRRRVWDGHALMLKKRGVKKYYGFGEKP